MISKKRNTFSLIELISVIAIMVIIMAVTLPAFLTMTKGQSVELAAREIGSKLKAVRSYAITNRVRAALVFVTTNNDTTNNDRYRFKAYRTCIVTGTTGNWVFDRWVSDEKWEFLPTGVIIQGISSTKDLQATSINTRFNGDDDIKTPTDATVLTNPAQPLPGIIFKATGDVEGNNVFFFIGEGDSNGDIRNPQNFTTIKVDQYTGRISYYIKGITEGD